jgi:hypothetical protein
MKLSGADIELLLSALRVYYAHVERSWRLADSDMDPDAMDTHQRVQHDIVRIAETLKKHQ